MAYDMSNSSDIQVGEQTIPGYDHNAVPYEDLLLAQYVNFTMNDHETSYQLTHYLSIAGLTIACLGIIGNSLSLIVLNQRSFHSATYSYLSALAVCDTLMLLSTIVVLWKDITPRSPYAITDFTPENGWLPFLFPFFHATAFTFQVTSIWLTLAFTVDRYIMICHPYSAERFCSTSRARKVVAGLCIAGVLFNLPKFFEYTTVVVELPDIFSANATGLANTLTDLGNSRIFKELYHSWFYIVFVCGVPFIVLAVLNIFLMSAVRESRRRGRALMAAERKRIDTTVMLISVVIVFFLCQTTALVSRIIWAFNKDQTKAFNKPELFTLNEVGNLLIIVNSSINIVPYYFFGKRFRSQFYKLYCRCLVDKTCECAQITSWVWIPKLIRRRASFGSRNVTVDEDSHESRTRMSVCSRHADPHACAANGSSNGHAHNTHALQALREHEDSVSVPTVAVAVAMPGKKIGDGGIYSATMDAGEKERGRGAASREVVKLLKPDEQTDESSKL